MATEVYSLTVLKVEVLSGHTHSERSRDKSLLPLPASSGSQHSLASGLITLISASVFTWSSLHVIVCVPSLWGLLPVTGLGPNAVWPHLNLISTAKAISKKAFTHRYKVNMSFGGHYLTQYKGVRLHICTGGAGKVPRQRRTKMSPEEESWKMSPTSSHLGHQLWGMFPISEAWPRWHDLSRQLRAPPEAQGARGCALWAHLHVDLALG